MKHTGRKILTLALLLTAFTPVSGRTCFSTMTVAEISALLDSTEALNPTDGRTVSAKDTAISGDPVLALPLKVTVHDMLGKVYGFISPYVSRSECIDRSRSKIRLSPEDDNGILWLETGNGYRLNYYGLIPEVCAMARWDGDETAISDFCYFFLFPYSGGSRHAGMRSQTDFCGTLLQEMADIGLQMDLNTMTDGLFEAVGDYNGSFVNVRLVDDRNPDGNGRYILILSVEPDAFSESDNVAAI